MRRKSRVDSIFSFDYIMQQRKISVIMTAKTTINFESSFKKVFFLRFI